MWNARKTRRVNEAIARACARPEAQPAACSPVPAAGLSVLRNAHLDTAAQLWIGAEMARTWRGMIALGDGGGGE